jgi:hypothetical protein
VTIPETGPKWQYIGPVKAPPRGRVGRSVVPVLGSEPATATAHQPIDPDGQLPPSTAPQSTEPVPRESCYRPFLMRSPSGEIIQFSCGTTSRAKCAPCSEKHRRRVGRIFQSGWQDRLTDRFWFVTLTAPGRDVLPWDTDRCSHLPSTPCSGNLGCKVQEIPAAEWNSLAGQRFSWLMEYLRRTFGPVLPSNGNPDSGRPALPPADALLR